MIVPYYSQFETPEIVVDFLRDGSEAALPRDPLWAQSGAEELSEYVRWAGNVCGMACLKMILAARIGQVHPTLTLARECTSYGGYILQPDGSIKGLIYAPFVQYVKMRFDIEAEVVTGVSAVDLGDIMENNAFFLASVHPSIRWPDREPPSKGGHLVLVTAASDSTISFHNPSGHTPQTQKHVRSSFNDFDRFFAGRGVAIRKR